MSPNPSVQLVANATSSRWSQAYSTLNLYIALHVGGDDVASMGKEILERVQREYFALDEKSLAHIKEAVMRVASDVDPALDFSLTLAAVIDSVVYIVIASCGQVALLRGGRYGVVASGTRGSVDGFSGAVQDGDVLVIGTCDFFDKVGAERLRELPSRGVQDIAESLAPEIHTNSTGGEAAIVVQIGAESSSSFAEAGETEEAMERAAESPRFSFPQFQVPAFFDLLVRIFHTRRREAIIVTTIVVLVGILGILLVRDRIGQQEEKASSVLASVQGEVNELLENADAMSGVEPSRAIEFLREAEEIVLSKMNTVEKGSVAYQELSGLLDEIRGQLDALEGGERVSLSPFFEDAQYTDPLVTAGDSLYAVSGSQVALLSSEGEIEDAGEIDEDAIALSSIENFLYVLTEDGVVRVDGGNFSSETVSEETGIDISAYGSNVYVLTEDDILRLSGETASSYFGESPLSEATSLAIDGAVYVFESGDIMKFLRGESESFELEGLVTPLGTDSQLYTNAELEELYVLDAENSRVVVLSKEGAYQNQYKSEKLSSATSFVVQGDTVYVSSPDGISTFEL